MKIIVEPRKSGGRVVYDACNDKATLLLNLMAKRSFNDDDLVLVKKLGFDVIIWKGVK